MKTKTKTTKNVENSYAFLSGLCASKKVIVADEKGKADISKAVGLCTIRIFNEYRKNNEKFDACKNLHAEKFAEMVGTKVSAYGFDCSFLKGKNTVDRYMVFNKAPKGLKKD